MWFLFVVLAVVGCVFASEIFVVPSLKPSETHFGEDDFGDLFEHVHIGFSEIENEDGVREIARGICIVKRKGYKIGMKFFQDCKEAQQVCSIMIFPEIASEFFTMKGVKFPVRIIAVGINGRKLMDGVFTPENGLIRLPPATMMVVEIPVCDNRKYGGR